MSKIPLINFANAPLEIIDGDRGENYPKKNDFTKNGYCVFLNTGNVTKEGFDFADAYFITKEKDDLLRKGKANRDDIILTTRGTVGNVAYYSISTPFSDIRINSGMVLIRAAKKNIDPYYLYIFLRSDLFKKQISFNVSGSAQPQLPISSLENINIPIPDISRQKSISKILSKLDEKISLNNHINTELEQMAKTIYNYWFVQFDFPDEKGKPYKTSGGEMKWNAELKREIPVGWEVKRIDEVATVKAGGDKPDIFSIEKTEQCLIPIYSNGIDNEGLYGFTNEATIQKQSITVSARGTIGYCVLRNNPFAPIIRLIVVTPNIVGSAKYFYEFLKSLEYGKTGSVQQQLTVPEISSWKIINPANDVLKKFDEITSVYVNKIELLKKETHELITLRDFLLPLLMNGQVKVK